MINILFDSVVFYSCLNEQSWSSLGAQQLSNFPVRPQSERLCRVLHRTTASTPERLNDLWREVLRMVSLNRIYRIKSSVEAEWKDLEDITPKLVERVWKIMEEGLTKRKHEDDDEVIVKCEQPTPKVFIDSPDVTIASLPQLSNTPHFDLSNISCPNSPLTTPATSPALKNFPNATGEITNPNYFQFECSPYLSSTPSLGGNSPYLPTPVELTFDLPTDATLTKFQSPLIPKSNPRSLTLSNCFDSSLNKKSETGIENETWEPTWNDSLICQTSDYPFCLDMDALSKLTMSISPSNSSFDPISKDCCDKLENATNNKSNSRNDTIQSGVSNIDSHANKHCNLTAHPSLIKPPTEADGVVSLQNSNTEVTNTSPIHNQCSTTSTNYSKPPVYIEIEFSTSPDSTEIAKAHSGPTIVRSPNLGTGCSHVMRPQIKSYFSCAEREGYICTLENL
ncbi:hypothetical protein BKA69DRAFT_674424 [Paraphysoderma sedebokerense]|nr:hypothetical protein BKA69DRAFT_674424 [Paraphysoderma sedebokerense]